MKEWNREASGVPNLLYGMTASEAILGLREKDVTEVAHSKPEDDVWGEQGTAT